MNTLTVPFDVSLDDSYSWCVGDVVCQGFSTAKTWDVLRPRDSEKSGLTLFGSRVQCLSTMWVCHLNRLPTRQRIASWGQISSSDCYFCTIETETRDHLFLVCDFSSQLWELVFNRLCPRQRLFSSWLELLSWTRQSSAAAPSLLRKVATQALIYNVWRQRNNVLFNAKRLPPLLIFRMLDRELRNIITSRQRRKRWRDLMLLWIR